MSDTVANMFVGDVVEYYERYTMTPESIKMSNLILGAEMECNKRGHLMNWQRFNNYHAKATCRECDCWVNINIFSGPPMTQGSAVYTNCKGLEL